MVEENKSSYQIERRKLFEKLIEITSSSGRKRYTEKQALEKVYLVRVQKKGGNIGCRINLPSCLAYKKVKLKIVE